MSFSLFKQNMKMYMQNQEGITSSDDWAKKVTQEYDMCIKRGLQTVNNIPISAGNTSLMETLVRIALKLSLSNINYCSIYNSTRNMVTGWVL